MFTPTLFNPPPSTHALGLLEEVCGNRNRSRVSPLLLQEMSLETNSLEAFQYIFGLLGGVVGWGAKTMSSPRERLLTASTYYTITLIILFKQQMPFVVCLYC